MICNAISLDDIGAMDECGKFIVPIVVEDGEFTYAAGEGRKR